MKQRNVIAVIILSIITLGIYDLYWLVKTKKVLNQQTDIHTPTVWLLFAPVLVMIGLLIAIIAVTTMSVHSSSVSPHATAITSGLTALLYLLAFLAILPITFYWFLKFSKAVNHFTRGEINTAMAFILLWLLRFIGMAIIQDKFNDMAAAGQGPAPVPIASSQSAQTSPQPAPQSPDQPSGTPPNPPTVG